MHIKSWNYYININLFEKSRMRYVTLHNIGQYPSSLPNALRYGWMIPKNISTQISKDLHQSFLMIFDFLKWMKLPSTSNKYHPSEFLIFHNRDGRFVSFKNFTSNFTSIWKISSVSLFMLSKKIFVENSVLTFVFSIYTVDKTF